MSDSYFWVFMEMHTILVKVNANHNIMNVKQKEKLNTKNINVFVSIYWRQQHTLNITINTE